MMNKIAIIGTHGVGKTTLAFSLAAQMKLEGENVKMIGETARICPFSLNKGFTVEAALWIYHTQMQKELEASKSYSSVVCDRSVIDSFMYAKAMGFFDSHTKLLIDSYAAATEWMSTYTNIYFVRKGSTAPTSDGTRDTDIKYQQEVENCFEEFLYPFRKKENFDILTSDELFHELLR